MSETLISPWTLYWIEIFERIIVLATVISFLTIFFGLLLWRSEIESDERTAKMCRNIACVSAVIFVLCWFVPSSRVLYALVRRLYRQDECYKISCHYN